MIINTITYFTALMIAFNLMPIPPLDGFKMGEYAVEGFTGKKLSPEQSMKINKIG